jgi:hypothetical protein
MGLTGRGLSATNALDELRSAIRYQIELCPCSSVDAAASFVANDFDYYSGHYIVASH